MSNKFEYDEWGRITLNGKHIALVGCCETSPNNDELKTAKTIVDTLNEVERLKSQNDELQRMMQVAFDKAAELKAENEKLKEAAAVLVDALVDIRSEMTRSESQINHDWCIDTACEALKQYREMTASEGGE